MVKTELNPDNGNIQFVLTPNNSASWQFNIMIWASLALIAMFISTIFLLRGLWLILPFSGLELLAVYVGLYLVIRKNSRIEIIKFSDDKVTIEKGHNYCEQIWEYQRYWSKIFIKQPAYRGHPKHIFIRSHGKELELGEFLNKSDKEKLIKKLKKAVYA